ncbi:MAG: hypothetical protein ABI203_03830, partial [Mucilaginibacter sp.]
DVGTGLELAEPLKFDHSANMPFGVRGTGISFEPATSFAHSSNEPVLALSSSITLARPLANHQDINTTVRDEKVKTSGYQGAIHPNQWFGGPQFAPGAGSMTLRDANGNIVDGLNYGAIVDPWLAEGYQGMSGTNQDGCFVPSPGTSRRFPFGPSSAAQQPIKSAGRFPDGFDSDNNCSDFRIQNTLTLATTAKAGANNIKVSSVANLKVAQKLIIGADTHRETVVIAAIGTAGGTTIATANATGATVITVGSVVGFEPGQTITIGTGSDRETGVVASVVAGRRRFGPGGGSTPSSITVKEALKYSHAADDEVSGSGITLAKPLLKPHAAAASVVSNIPTPGAPNQYIKKN